jgi:hypothetical protein
VLVFGELLSDDAGKAALQHHVHGGALICA